MAKKQLELSIISNGDTDQVLAKLGLGAQIIKMNWETYWRDLLNIALFKHGADVSQIGAPSTGAVVSMNAVRPFSRPEINALGGAEAFLPVSWQSTQVSGDAGVWAIPYIVDTRVIIYWRDMLEEAGIDEISAFDTPDHLEDTLSRLQANGFETPWGIETQLPFSNLQNIASWLWNAGGTILSEDGRSPTFAEPNALRGIQQYYRLQKYLSPKLYQKENPPYSVNLFLNREVAVAMGNPNLHSFKRLYAETPEVLDNIGVALPPGPSYIGGSNLIIWSHSRHPSEAVELVRQLTSQEIQKTVAEADGLFPVRQDVLSEPPYTTDPHLKVMVKALQTGRAYPTFRRWGLVEERLSIALTQIWDDLVDNPDADLKKVLNQHLGTLSKRLEITLKEFN